MTATPDKRTQAEIERLDARSRELIERLIRLLAFASNIGTGADMIGRYPRNYRPLRVRDDEQADHDTHRYEGER